jgi:hypothetical protein
LYLRLDLRTREALSPRLLEDNLGHTPTSSVSISGVRQRICLLNLETPPAPPPLVDQGLNAAASADVSLVNINESLVQVVAECIESPMSGLSISELKSRGLREARRLSTSDGRSSRSVTSTSSNSGRRIRHVGHSDFSRTSLELMGI